MSKINTKINYSNIFSGCLISLENIDLMYNIIIEYIQNIKQYESELQENTKINVLFKNQPHIIYSSYEELKNDNKLKIYSIEELSISISSNYLLNIQIVYNDNGNVKLEVSGYFSELNDCWNHLYNTLYNKMRHRDIIEKLFFNKHFITVIQIFSIIYIIFTLNNIYSSSRRYFLAKEIGVNIDESLIPLNNSIFIDIENAIKSDDLHFKLDTLLRMNLNNFTNSDDYINYHIRQIKNNIVRLLSTIIGLFLLIAKTKKTHSYNITIGLNEQYYKKKEKYKYFWTITIILSIFINIVSNFLSKLFIENIF